jgi:hypothetical protein
MSYKLISAAEARKKVQTAQTETAFQQLNTVARHIADAIEKGAYSVSIELYLQDGVKETLKGLGYTVRYDSHRNESYTTISW